MRSHLLGAYLDPKISPEHFLPGVLSHVFTGYHLLLYLSNLQVEL